MVGEDSLTSLSDHHGPSSRRPELPPQSFCSIVFQLIALQVKLCMIADLFLFGGQNAWTLKSSAQIAHIAKNTFIVSIEFCRFLFWETLTPWNNAYNYQILCLQLEAPAVWVLEV